MRRVDRWKIRSGAIAAGALALGAFAATAPAMAAQAKAGPVSTNPARGTPALVKTSGKETGNVRQLVQCGGMMYAVGKFTAITQGGRTFSRSNVFSFKATAPYTVSGLNVGVNGVVNSVAFNGSNCTDAYIGGSFTSVHGTTARNIAEINTSTGAVVKTFGRNANGEVDTLLGHRGHLLVGGHFTSVNGSGRDYYASLSPSSGKDDGFLNLNIHGGVRGSPTLIYNQQLSHSGNLLLVEGNFASAGGRPRQQIFMANLSGSTAKVTGWTSPEFSQHCVTKLAFYVRAAAWSPGDSTVYTATTGLHLLTWNHTFPLTGLCDSVAAFPATQRSVTHTWIEYSGCDSYYSVAADNGAVYAAGHPRWAHNQDACNGKGPGAITDRGMQGLNPGNGAVELNSQGTAKYHMSRANADDMLITSAGLWIASSNRFGSDNCNNVSGLTGICFLPYS